MKDDRQFREAIDRSVSIMVRYHGAERSDRSNTSMVAEVAKIAAWAAEGLHLSSAVAEGLIGPVGAALDARYGAEVGPRIAADFSAAFREAARRLGGPEAGRPGQVMGRGPVARGEILARVRSLKGMMSGLGEAVERHIRDDRREATESSLERINAKLDAIVRDQAHGSEGPRLA